MATRSDEENELSRDKNMPFLEHLGELRTTLVHCLLALSPGLLLSLIFYDSALFVFVRLLPKGGRIVLLTPIEKFFAILKIAFVGGIFLGFPVILYEIWKFVAPGLYKREKRVLLPFILSGWTLFVIGIVFCYTVALPFCIRFLVQFGSTQFQGEREITNMWGTGAFVNFSLGMLLGFGAGFNLPVVLVSLNLLDVLRIDTLRHCRRYAVVLSLAVGAVLTPQDIVSMLLLAVPLYILYEGSILTIRLLEWRRSRREAKSTSGE